MELIECYFDGCCEPKNPGGNASYGASIRYDGGTVWQDSGYLGVGPGMSNNVAEYYGVIALLGELQTFDFKRAEIRGDSKLVINQLYGLWGAHEGLYLPLYTRALKMLAELRADHEITFEWIPRAENEECDELSKEVLRNRGVVFQIQADGIMPFGKYKGWALADAPKGYLIWMLKNCKLREPLKADIENAVNPKPANAKSEAA